MTATVSTRANSKRRRLIVAGAAALGVAAMLGLSYAAVPLYAAFCKATGYGGTTQVAAAAPQTRGARKITVRVDANVAPGLPWVFEPEAAKLEIVPGETVTAFYKVRNTSNRAMDARPACARSLPQRCWPVAREKSRTKFLASFPTSMPPFSPGL